MKKRLYYKITRKNDRIQTIKYKIQELFEYLEPLVFDNHLPKLRWHLNKHQQGHLEAMQMEHC